jgi:beta-aspartyl-dipeptidase (metallo-type)
MSPRSDSGQISAILLRGGTVVQEYAVSPQDVLIVGDRIVAVERGITDVVIPQVDIEEIDVDGRLVLPALVDHHCHPTGGGGGGGPHTQGLPLLLEEFTTAGVGSFVGCLGHDTSVRRPESLLSRVRALRLLGLRGHMFTGEITTPPVTLSGSIDRDIFLFDEVRGAKASVGEVGSLRSADTLADVAAQVARGSRTAGKPAVLHLHVGQQPKSLSLIAEAVHANLVDPSTVTLTHVNWNRGVLDACKVLAGLGVNVDVTACIRPDFFPGSIDPPAAVDELLAECPHTSQVTVSSDSGGSHAAGPGLVRHTPGLMLATLRTCLQAKSVPINQLAAAFATNTAERLDLRGIGAVTTGAFADILLIDPEGKEPISLILAGKTVVRSGQPLTLDPIGVRQ